MTLWIYYETDGDAGWYAVRLFSTKARAEGHKLLQDRTSQAYSHIAKIQVY